MVLGDQQVKSVFVNASVASLCDAVATGTVKALGMLGDEANSCWCRLTATTSAAVAS